MCVGSLHESLLHLRYKWLKIASGRRSRPNGAPGTRGRFGIAPLIDGGTHVRCTVARARGEVGPTRGITVIAAPGAAAAAVMPRTPGLPRDGDARGAARAAATGSIFGCG